MKHCPLADVDVPSGKECDQQNCKFWLVTGCAVVIGAQIAEDNHKKLEVIMKGLSLKKPSL